MPPFVDGPSLRALLRPSTNVRRTKLSDSGGGGGGGGGILKMFKLLPMLTSGCKMVALLGRHNKALLADHATTVTLFGHRRGRVSLAIHVDTRAPPVFLIELPMLTSALHKEMASGDLKLALESDTRSARRRLVEEYVWAVYCNGRKAGYSIRRKEASDDERHVLRLLRSVSMGAGVLPAPAEKDGAHVGPDGELTYMRARVERVVGSKDSEAFYMINPDDGRGNAGGGGSGSGAPELSIFLVRMNMEQDQLVPLPLGALLRLSIRKLDDSCFGALCDVNSKEETNRKFQELYQKYKQMLYGPDEFDESLKVQEEVLHEACAIYQIV